MTDAAKPIKLTDNQWLVLRNAKAGHVYRSESGLTLYICYDEAQKHKRVTAAVNRLYALGLLKIGELLLMQRRWQVTERGEKALLEKEGP